LGGFALRAMAALFLVGKPAALPPTCRLSPGGLVFGMDRHATLATGAGAPCAFTLRIAATSIESIEMLTPPGHGTTSLSPHNRIHYRPNGTFRGEDSFEVAVRGRSPADDRVAVVRVDVGGRYASRLPIDATSSTTHYEVLARELWSEVLTTTPLINEFHAIDARSFVQSGLKA